MTPSSSLRPRPATPRHRRPPRTLGTLGTLGAVVTLAAGLSACGSSGSTGSPAPSASATAGASTPAAAGSLRVVPSSLGSIVADGQGRTLYMFTKDSPGSGASSCAGPCAQAWPAFTVDGAPVGAGVTGALGVLTTTDGKQQVTLGGWPLYYFAKDSAPGDVRGQDVNKVWYVLSPDGKPVTAGASDATTSGSTAESTAVGTPDDGGGSGTGY